jgi:hypothetical protein
LGIQDCAEGNLAVGLKCFGSFCSHSRLPPFPQRARKEWGTQFYV